MHAHIYLYIAVSNGKHADSDIKRSPLSRAIIFRPHLKCAEGTGLGRAATKLMLYVVCIGITTKCWCTYVYMLLLKNNVIL